MKSLFYSLLSC